MDKRGVLQNAAYIELFCSTPLLIDERILLQVKMRYNEFIHCASVLPEYNADSTLVSELRQEGEKWRN
ncbi:MAG: hypothetical protein HFG83_13135 [Dorea sp.]|nr:hypothetical protein [Dorea sp.]MCI9454748.1 hypothetical protein [Dorea sp.]